ncbi:MAG: sigma-54 dependent transcriptional regulator [Bacteroidetes bacterium]|nr:sigma-54 dependent transcriptional regulator [Bacteroidota bacterium]
MAIIQSNILIIDDNKEIRESLELFLRRHFSNIKTLSSPKTLISTLNQEDFDVILLDMNFLPGKHSGNEGMFWLREILNFDREAIVILITAYGKVNIAVEAIKEGAFNFILKPWDNNKLLSSIKAGIKLRKSQQEVEKLKVQKKALNSIIDQNFSYLKGLSPEIRQVDELIDKVAETDANILILGENGTGKEFVARQIHKKSKRNDQVFMSVDLSALTETLFESELFGYTKGAFTDAKEDKQGKIEAAHGGTLFLDEIGNLSMHLQSKLLTVLQTKSITRIGSNKPIPVDFRLICATNKPLHTLISENQFREDLLFRINTVEIEVPPLRKRKKDLTIFSNYFLDIYSKKYGKGKLELSKSANQKLENYSWPGNIRELKHAMERAVILTTKNTLTPDDFAFTDLSSNTAHHDTLNLDELEKLAIQKAIKKSEGNMSKAADLLGISRTTLYAKISKYGI